MKKLITTLYNNSVIRYVFFGGCTTLVNLASFYLLRRADVEINIANLISIILAILFAYAVNSRKGRVGCCRIYPCRGKRQTDPYKKFVENFTFL